MKKHEKEDHQEETPQKRVGGAMTQIKEVVDKVETKIKTIPFSALLHDNTLFALVDTEGFDCHIIAGTTPESNMPPFLLYEVKHCKRKKFEASSHLEKMGYEVSKHGENRLAVRKRRVIRSK